MKMTSKQKSDAILLLSEFFSRTFTTAGDVLCQQGKGEAISLTPVYHVHPLH